MELLNKAARSLPLMPIILALVAAMVAIFLTPMAVLTADKVVRERGAAQRIDVYPVGVDIIYKGAIVSVNAAGYLVAGSDTASEFCVGIAEKNVDNSGGSAGDLSCPVRSGVAVLLTAVSITQAMVGELMVIVDDSSVDDAGGATNDISVGRLIDFVSTTSGWVYIPAGGGAFSGA